MIQKTVTLFCLLSLLAFSSCADQTTASDETAQEQAMKDVVERAAEYINARNYEALRDVIAEDYLRHSQATPSVNVTSFDEFIAFLNEGDRVAFTGRYEGTHTSEGPFVKPPSYVPLSERVSGTGGLILRA